MRSLYSMLCALLTVSAAWGSDDEISTRSINMREIHPLTQEIIKKGLTLHGICYFDAENRKAEEAAKAYNANPEHERCMVPSWRLETTFLATDTERDPLTQQIYTALASAQTKNQHAPKGHLIGGYLFGQTQYALQADGSVKCTIFMQGVPYMWAKEYSENN